MSEKGFEISFLNTANRGLNYTKVFVLPPHNALPTSHFRSQAHTLTAVSAHTQTGEHDFTQKAGGCYLELREKDVSCLDNAISAGAKSHF